MMFKKLYSASLERQSTRQNYLESGMSLIEVMVSVTLLAIIALGTAQYLVFARWDIDKGIRQQLAWMNMSSRLEEAIDYGFFSVQDSLPETDTALSINGVQAYRTSTVTAVDDPLDGTYPTDPSQPDYYAITISLSWFTADNYADTLQAYISESMTWSY